MGDPHEPTFTRHVIAHDYIDFYFTLLDADGGAAFEAQRNKIDWWSRGVMVAPSSSAPDYLSSFV
eukprot:CAMPEP_0185769120 /NCGR_PEP_ID=MMETSP1174-20130828/53382_1 /TAXON_ID=35687 /ORGANISM="Dictyocha speculum, Strain CCMP1381" /LENGTH=64 /DNA_ID=CAMNT_0028454077 /DNA_START=698 /DNA_END=888 /DNA_ORIENTATION=-